VILIKLLPRTPVSESAVESRMIAEFSKYSFKEVITDTELETIINYLGI
jgi:hypothetical protein